MTLWFNDYAFYKHIEYTIRKSPVLSSLGSRAEYSHYPSRSLNAFSIPITNTMSSSTVETSVASSALTVKPLTTIKPPKKLKPARKQVKPGEVEKKEAVQTGKEYSS